MGLILFEIMIRLYFVSIFFVYSLLYCYIGVKKMVKVVGFCVYYVNGMLKLCLLIVI